MLTHCPPFYWTNQLIGGGAIYVYVVDGRKEEGEREKSNKPQM